jgi:hypothetical protein
MRNTNIKYAKEYMIMEVPPLFCIHIKRGIVKKVLRSPVIISLLFTPVRKVLRSPVVIGSDIFTIHTKVL